MEHPIRVAIVDDDQAFRRALTRLLITMGFEVWSCASAEELLASPDALSHDCVVLDVHLPRMNGIELRHRLHEVCPGLPVLLMTADVMLAHRPAMLGGAVCLEKTVRESLLAETIHALVAARVAGDDRSDTTEVR
jgi:two-component system, LuxR family, response regulator FixJ